MANQILIDPFPGGSEITSSAQVINGTIALAGAAVSTGEPLNWASLVTGVGYNEINRVGGGQHGNGTALVTTFAASGGTVTATAANNFSPGQIVAFSGNTSTLGLLLNGTTSTVVTASATQFTFLSSATGTGTGEVGLAYAYAPVMPLQGANSPIAATISAFSASGGIITVTAANTYLPGAQVTFTSAASGIGVGLNGLTLTVLSSTSTAFRVASSVTGATGVGTASGINPPQPFSVKVWSELASGFVYQYSRTTGTLFVMETAGFTPAGTNDSATPPIFTGTAVPAAPLLKLAAAAYPSGVLNDVIRFEAKFQKA